MLLQCVSIPPSVYQYCYSCASVYSSTVSVFFFQSISTLTPVHQHTPPLEVFFLQCNNICVVCQHSTNIYIRGINETSLSEWANFIVACKRLKHSVNSAPISRLIVFLTFHLSFTLQVYLTDDNTSPIVNRLTTTGRYTELVFSILNRSLPFWNGLCHTEPVFAILKRSLSHWAGLCHIEPVYKSIWFIILSSWTWQIFYMPNSVSTQTVHKAQYGENEQ